MSQPIKFFYDLMSQPSRALFIFLRQTKIPFDDHQIALRKGVHLTDEYKKTVNRFQKVPAIVDNDYQLSESIAIFRYLTAKNKIANHWYSSDLSVRGRIDEYLEWQHNNTRATCSNYFILKYLKPRVAGKAPDDDRIIASAQKQMEHTLDDIEKYWLKDNGPFIAGQDLSFADLMAACELEQTKIAGYDPCIGRPKLYEWLNAVKAQTNPDYDEAHAIAYKLTIDNPAAY